MTRILIVEDNPDISAGVSDLLTEHGFSVSCSFSRQNALKELEHTPCDLVLLDIGLPDGSGYSLCTDIKSHWKLPVIFLTAMSDEASTVTGFTLGADDYIAKPFRPLELISRIKNVLQRCGKSPSVCTLGDLSIDTVKASVSRDGREIHLSALEYRLLLVFLNHPGQVLSRNRLLDAIWDFAGEYVNDNTLTVTIKRLREKIEPDPSSPTIIRTVRGLGYKAGE